MVDGTRAASDPRTMRAKGNRRTYVPCAEVGLSSVYLCARIRRIDRREGDCGRLLRVHIGPVLR